MTAEKNKWMVTVAKSGVLEIEAGSEQEAYTVLNDVPLTTLIQWEDSWNVVDIERIAVNKKETL